MISTYSWTIITGRKTNYCQSVLSLSLPDSSFSNISIVSCWLRKIRFHQSQTLSLLSFQLSSIPEVNNSTSPQKPVAKPEEAAPTAPQTSETTEPASQDVETPVELPQGLPEPSHRPEYDRFIKMVQVGVPLQAVKLKVSLEGLDPEVLEKILAK